MPQPGLTQLQNTPARTLLQLMPHMDQDLLHDARLHIFHQAFRSTAGTWQEALNEVSRATPARPGQITFHSTLRCSTCNGQRIDMRRGRVCHTCMGRGRKRGHVTQMVMFAPVPVSECAVAQGD